MERAALTISQNNWQSAKVPDGINWPNHVVKFLAYLESKQFSHAAGFDGLDGMQMENYGRLVLPLTVEQTKTLCYELFKSFTWMPSGAEVSATIDRLFPQFPGHVAESRRPVQQVVGEYRAERLLAPVPKHSLSPMERFKAMQSASAQRGEPFNLAQALRPYYPNVTEREQKRKELLHKADKRIGTEKVDSVRYAELAWEIFHEELMEGTTEVMQ